MACLLANETVSAQCTLDEVVFNTATTGPTTTTTGVIEVNIDAGFCSSELTIEAEVSCNSAPTNESFTIELPDGTSQGGVGYRIDANNFNVFPVGTSTVTFLENANSFNDKVLVTVVDNVVPDVQCKMATVFIDATGTGTIKASDVDNGTTDNCATGTDLVLTVSQTDFTCTDSGTGTVSVQLKATDASGMSAECTAKVEVIDIVAVSAFCKDFTLELDATGNTPTVKTSDVDDESSDNCSVTLSIKGGVGPFDCSDVGETTVVILKAKSPDGRTDDCGANVKIKDLLGPNVKCKMNPSVDLDASGMVILQVSDVDDGTTDNCGIPTLSLNRSDFSCADTSPVSVILKAVDGGGNTTTCIANVTLQDVTAPSAICQAVTVDLVLDANGSATVDVTQIDNGSTDACSMASVVLLNGGVFGCTDVGALRTVTLVVTDASGNTDACNASTRVVDNAAPATGCLTSVTVSIDATGTGTLLGSDIEDGNANDNCSFTITPVQTLFTCADISPMSVINVVFEDPSGNASNCNVNVAILDKTPPTALCKPVTVNLDANGTATIQVSDVDNNSTDGCQGVSLSLDKTSFTCADGSPTTAVLTVMETGGSNLTATCNAQITIIENLAPTAICKAATVMLDASGTVTITASDVDGGSTDNCGTPTLTIDVNSFTCASSINNNVTLTATDASGNTDNCTAQVTVKDGLAPDAICATAITVDLDMTGNATIELSDIDNGTTDNCGITAISLDNTAFTCGSVPSQTVTLTATDFSNNTSTCSTVVTIKDVTPPTAVCQDVTVLVDAAGNASITTAMVDNGSTDACQNVTLSLDQMAFNCTTATNPSTVTLTVTENGGNGFTNSCTAEVTIKDNIVPDVICLQNITVNLDATGNATITGNDIDNGTTDNCNFTLVPTQTAFDCSDITVPSVPINGIATDDSGNSSNGLACQVAVTVKDETAPKAKCQAVTVTLSGSGTATITTADVDNGSSDNCQTVSLALDKTAFACSTNSPETVTLTVTENGGDNLSATCTAQVTIKGNAVPDIQCKPITVNLDANGMASIQASDVDAGTTDNCSFTITATPTMFTCANTGNNNVTLTATDNVGQTAQCTAVVTVKDVTAPVVTCKPTTVILDGTGNASIAASDVLNTASDNCGMAGLTYMVMPSAFTCANVGTATTTLTATDASGNAGTCVANVEVIDNTTPQAVCKNITVNLDNNGTVTIAASDVDGGSTDNCNALMLSIDVNTFNCPDVGPKTVVLTATTTTGTPSSTTCDAIVTVEDNLAPNAKCKDITVQLDANGSAVITPADIDNGSSDACQAVVLSINTTSFSCTGTTGANVVTLTATEAAGNQASNTCTANVSVEDNIAPTITCPIDIFTCNINVTVPQPAFGDNCSATITNDFNGTTNASGTYPTGVTTVVWTVTDASGNTASCSMTVEVSNTPLEVTVTPSDNNGFGVSCFGDTNGTALVKVTGGSGSYSYMWSDGQTTEQAGNLAAGFYTVTVTDLSGSCSTVESVIITEPTEVSCEVVHEDITCANLNDGTATVFPDGGVTDVLTTIQWFVIDNGVATAIAGATGTTINNLSAGDYGVQVTDANGCICQSTFTIDNPAPLGDALGGEFNTSEGGDNGSGQIGPFNQNTATIEVTGGTPPYSYLWEADDNVQYSIENNNLVTVNYSDNATWSVTITDANGCAGNSALTFGNTDNTNGGTSRLDAETVEVADDCSTRAGDGSITVNIIEGTAPFTYSWEDALGNSIKTETTTVTSSTIDGRGKGWHYVTVEDATGQRTDLSIWLACANRSQATLGRPKTSIIDGTATQGLNVYPNPFTDKATIDFEVAETGNVRVEIFDLAGKVVAQLFNGVAEAGVVNTVSFEANNLASGVYVCKFTNANGESTHEKVILTNSNR